MTRKEYLHFLKKEVYEFPYYGIKNHFLRNIYLKYFCLNTNAVFLIRKMMYLGSKRNIIAKIRSRLILKKLQCSLNIYINPLAKIGLGLKLEHAFNIVIGEATIGKNCTLLHNVTIGSKRIGDSSVLEKPSIGDNFVLYSNSMVIGPIHICNDVNIGVFSLVNKDINEPGLYTGIPAMKKGENI